ncbi:hypothetical protein, partial [Bradyrhizobium japonicum]
MTDKTIRRLGAISKLTTSERRPVIRTLRGWAIHVLQETGAIRECEEHGWMQDRADPHARERAFDCHSACNIDPPYCRICECYPDGAVAAVDAMST